ncbi:MULTISPECIES: hypothetical protein [Deferrisoma]
MLREYRTIRNRYDDVLAGVSDYQMFRDIRALLRYIEFLHEQLAQYMLLVRAGLADEGAEELVN